MSNPEHIDTPPDPQPRERDRDDEIPDTPLDEPAPVPRIDPPPPVTPGPYVAIAAQDVGADLEVRTYAPR